jgi:CRP-like cAMP-binding protein
VNSDVVGDAVVGEAVRRLRATRLFDGLPPPDLEDLARACTLLSLRAGEVLVEAGSACDTFHLVERGRLRVARADELIAELHAGEHIGDAAVLGRVTNDTTVTAATDCRVFALSHDDFERFADTHPLLTDALRSIEERLRLASTHALRPDQSAIVGALRAFLPAAGDDVLKLIEDEVEWLPAPAGTVLAVEGEEADCMWVIVAGRVAISCSRKDGTEVRVDESGPGDTIGEMALLTREPRSATVTAVAETDLLRLSQEAFDRLTAEQPTVMRAISSVLVQRVNQALRQRSLTTQVRFMALATRAEVDEVVRTENLVLRNLRITQMYHRLSLEMTLLLGQHDANWCTYACNASKTAGYSIRREEVPFYEAMAALRRDLRVANAADRLKSRMTATTIGRLVDEALAAVSSTISAGNLKVFAELGPIFADFTRTFHEDHQPDQDKLERFLDTLQRGPTEDGGQDTLADALRHYYAAMFEPDPKRKAELTLLGNLGVGLHEQIRLQPHIAGAMDAPMRVGLQAIAASHHRLGWLPERAAKRLRDAVEHEEEILLKWVTARWRKRVTRNLMTLRLPYGSVRLGADVPHLPDKTMYPDVLRDLHVPELIAFIDGFDRRPDDVRDSRASDWASLDDRMTFIIELMRSRQRSLELFDQPFLLDQRRAIVAGVVPTGRL